jgi:hypothetical protein
MQKAAKRVEDAHRVNKVNVNLDSNPKAVYQPGKSHVSGYFTMGRLKQTITDDAGNALRANAKYADGMSIPALYRPSLAPANEFSHAIMDNQNSSLLEGLFRRTRIQGVKRPLHPEQVALLGLWQSLDETIKQMQADTFPAHRVEVRDIMKVPDADERERLFKSVRLKIDYEIGGRVATALSLNRERIGQESGIYLPTGIIGFFTAAKA